MAGKKRKPPTNNATARETIPDVYREMLVDAHDQIKNTHAADSPERPLKRKRPGEKPSSAVATKNADVKSEDFTVPQPTIQTVLRDTDDEDADDEIEFEDVEIKPAVHPPTRLTIIISTPMGTKKPQQSRRQGPVTKEDKERRLDIHKAHIVCLLAHVELRNRWCNDPTLKEILAPLLSKNTTSSLNPKPTLNQFSKTESLKKGISEAKELFKTRYSITERGLRRALWAETEEQLKHYKLPQDFESTHKRSDFLKAAKKLEGSRDVGAQLFCALLRSVGVEARLVCSLQPLSCAPGAPTMPKQREPQEPPKRPTKGEVYAAAMAKHETKYPEFQAGAAIPSPRARLGHPNATLWHLPSFLDPNPPPPPPRPASLTPKRTIRDESSFPVYWVEVLDVAQQKWNPVDPLVTFTQWNPRALEPPAADRENSLGYVVAFNPDGTAVDVTRRYAKAYNSKTRKQRVDGINPANTAKGERWWRRALRRYTRPEPTDLDQIEAQELTSMEAKEPMPRNMADFKDHPIYALERHLRRNEVLVPNAQPSGTVGAGSKAPLERIYRRRDVRIARTKEKWYRLGRLVLPDQAPVKVLPPPRKSSTRSKRFDDSEPEDEDDLFGDNSGIPLFVEAQTELYVPPPVVNGIVPKNKFGNLDIYVPSMVPRGGVHITHDRAAHAALILGVSYAPAVVGFIFKGRHGTAAICGVVVAAEYADAVRVVIEGLECMEAEEEEERKRREILRMWSKFLKVLRIRERVMDGVDEEAEEAEGGTGWGNDKGKERAGDVEMEDTGEEEEGGGGGGFVGLNDYSDDDGEGGGFMADDDGGAGGFIIE